jgi:SulP family sulfate permease
MEQTIAADRSRGSSRLIALRRDLIAGLTVATVAVPQAMAYALIAGLRPEYGLYTAVVMTALGSLFGSSSHLINGPTNAIALVVFGSIAGLSQGPDDLNRIQIVCLLAILAGLIQILIALLKLGDLTRYVSESVLLGFLAGAGVLVALGQVPNLLGLEQRGTGEDHFLYRLWLTLTQDSPVNFITLGIGLTTVALIYGFHQLGARLHVRLPELLITLLLVSLTVWFFELAPDEEDFRAVVQARLPPFRVPPFHASWIRQLWGGALAIALLGLLEAIAIAKAIATRTGERLDYNRQCLAEGLANVGSGFFQCMPGSGSFTRSAINYQAGALTRLSGIISALTVAVVLLLFAPLTHYLPRPALAGVLLWTAWRIVDRQRLAYCLRATRFDAGIALATAGAAIFISIEFSILIGTFLSFLFFVPRAARLQVTELVVGTERELRERQPDDPQCTRLAVFDFEGELFFGAAPELDEHLAELARRVKQGIRVIVLRLKRARNPDMVCLEKLQHFVQGMQGQGVEVLLCGVREDFARALHNVRIDQVLPADHLFREEAAVGSSTLQAVRRAYELLGEDRCPTCPRSRQREEDRGGWYYVI